jgi:hypothetical protein
MAGSLIQREDEDIYSAIKRAANSLLDVRLGRCSLAAFEILKKFSISSVSPEASVRDMLLSIMGELVY